MEQRNSRRATAPRYGYKTPKKQNDLLHLLLFYILPFLVFNGILFVLVTAAPKVTITVAPSNDYETTTVDVEIRSLLPIKAMTSTQESVPLELTKTEGGRYTADIIHNGVIEVSVASINGMVTNAYEPVNVLDETPPSILENFTIDDNTLTFFIEDSQSGIDYSSISATTPLGETVEPLSVDKTTGEVSFEMDPSGLTVHVSDLCGNTTKADFNPSSQEMTQQEETESEVSISE